MSGWSSARAQTNINVLPTPMSPDAAVAASTPAATLPTTPAASMVNSMDALNDQNKLASGDTLSYRVLQEQKDPIRLTVSETGELDLPLLGRISVTGKTCKSLAEELKTLLEKDYFYHATVIVGLDNLSNRSPGRVYVTGQVRSQGAIVLPPNENLTLSKAILANGGMADFADQRKVKLIRKKPGGGTTITIVDLKQIIDKGDLEKDPVLQPDDTIIVPEKLINF